MKINLNDWLGDHPWAWWLVVALACSGVELVVRTHRGRLAVLGALAASLTAVVAPRTQALQAGVAVLVVLVLTVWGVLTGRGVLTRRTRGYGHE